MRASLRVLIGKGTPQEIQEEASLLALKEKQVLKQKTQEEVKQFLVEHGLGVDCSGFVFHVLAAELREVYHTSWRSILSFPYATSMIRKCIASWRVVENTNVKTLAHDINSNEVALSDIRPGDLIIMLQAKTPMHHPDHIMLVESVTTQEGKQPCITYVHSFQWSQDGKYGHGIKRGTITVVYPHAPLIDQEWEESQKKGSENETWEHFKDATRVMIRRIRVSS